jgi:D-3-phosphoglycerate dehydrogenase
MISIFLKTGTEEHLVKGTVLHGNMPRLLHVDGIDVEAPLERDLIYLRNQDVPGVIGRVGTILGDHQINIADFSLGRRAENEGPTTTPREALAVVHVDGQVPDAVLAVLRKIPAVQRAKAIRLF